MRWKQLYRDGNNDVKVTGRLVLACCDCGLTHDIRLITKDDGVYFRISEDARATKRHRGTKEKLYIDKSALQKIAGWFGTVADLAHKDYLTSDDLTIARRIYEILGYPVTSALFGKERRKLARVKV